MGRNRNNEGIWIWPGPDRATGRADSTIRDASQDALSTWAGAREYQAIDKGT